jgi:hypothetical protein
VDGEEDGDDDVESDSEDLHGEAGLNDEAVA